MKTGMVFIFLLLAGCASQSEPYMMMEDAGNGFTFRKPMPDRRDFKPWEFYYKHCSESGNRSYYSKTSYDCNGPYY